MLRELMEKKRIALPDSDANISYLRFLEHYRDALASPKRYFLSGFPMIVVGILDTAFIVQFIIPAYHPNIFVTLLFVISNLLLILGILGGLYCLGIVTWQSISQVGTSGNWYEHSSLALYPITRISAVVSKCWAIFVLA